MTRSRSTILISVAMLGVVMPIHAAGAQGFRAEPSLACAFLAPEGLRTRGGYRETGPVYQCRTQRRDLVGGGPINNSIRFVATGDAHEVTQLRLELQVNSLETVQRTHRSLVRYAAALLKASVDAEMPDTIEKAILSAINGAWSVNGHSVSLQRIVLGGPGYELRLVIR